MSKKKLLVADDVEMNRRVIRRFLGRKFEIYEAEDGRQAMDVLHREHIDAILLDIIMPEMDGLEVLEEMSREPEFHRIAVLVATAAMEKTEREALGKGADDVVSKPYDPIVIQRRLDNILAKKQVEEENAALLSGTQMPILEKKNSALAGELYTIVAELERLGEIGRKNVDNRQILLELAEQLHSQAQGLKQLAEEIGKGNI